MQSSSGDAEPSLGDELPAAQFIGTHVVSDFAPVTVEYVPSGHATQSPVPFALL
jgi:hypothetical protein